MITRRGFPFFALWLVACALLLYPLLQSGVGDIAEYHALLEKVGLRHAGGVREPVTAIQERIGVCKEICGQGTGVSSVIRLRSEKSDLFYDQSSEGTGIIEKLQNVRCLFREELYYLLSDGQEAVQKNGSYRLRNSEEEIEVDTNSMIPMQTVRYIEADDAVYKITDNALTANKAHISLLQLPGHILPEIGHILPDPKEKSYIGEMKIAMGEKGLEFFAREVQGKLNFSLGSYEAD